MKNNIIGRVTAEERDNIQQLHERCNGLIELAKCLSSDDGEIYERVIQDIKITKEKYRNWWSAMAEKYNWDKNENNWTINFKTREISG